MSRALIFSTVFAATLAAPAMAQEISVDPAIELDAPRVSETELATPEWFRSFTNFSGVDQSLVWQLHPDEDLSLNWTKGARWALSIDLKSRDEESPLPREEMRAGATFRLTPRISVGGEFSIGAQELDDADVWEEQQLETGIRLKSAYKF